MIKDILGLNNMRHHDKSLCMGVQGSAVVYLAPGGEDCNTTSFSAVTRGGKAIYREPIKVTAAIMFVLS